MEATGAKRVAIVGSGCSGLGALWALRSTQHEVHLYEAASRLGGHTNTVPFVKGGLITMVDSGFIVLNNATYPNFIAFLAELQVPTVPTEMTFGISRDNGSFEWAGTSLSAVFAQRSNIFWPRMWRMIFDIIRFNEFAIDVLKSENERIKDLRGNISECHEESIGEYLDRENYSEAFRNDYLIPMTAAVWSTTPDKCSLEFPAITLVRFMWNHHLLNTVAARPKWMTIPGGANQYIEGILKGFPLENIHLETPVQSLETRADGKVIMKLEDKVEEIYDHVILATHGDQALELIRGNSTEDEVEVLSGFATSKNFAVLHSDLDLMPTRPVAWSAWNYITKTSPTGSDVNQICLTYWMNLLQHIPESKFGPVFVTLNPLFEPKSHLVQGRWEYSHPLYNAAAIRSQSMLPKIQNTRGISYAGAWTKYGFHEDGFSSGLKVAMDHLGAKIPFKFVDSTYSRGKYPTIGLGNHIIRGIIVVVQSLIIWIGILLNLPNRLQYAPKGAKKLN
ncbi:MAG: hypothetical protein M1829_006234 [Trizodia sp. TS-e1964]|nr:MAG: hypothetical protein M1829_006234 [Trizodia sp. TS-e1964]